MIVEKARDLRTTLVVTMLAARKVPFAPFSDGFFQSANGSSSNMALHNDSKCWFPAKSGGVEDTFIAEPLERELKRSAGAFQISRA